MPHPTELTVHQKSRVLDVAYDDGSAFSLPFEYLRVYSPSAEVKGHGPGQEVLQLGKREVGIADVEQVGNYAIKPTFSDGHDTGIFSWDYLYELGRSQESLWKQYVARLQAAGYDEQSGRAPVTQFAEVAAAKSGGGGCGSGSCGCK
ncbi:MAG: DUF971 domain-containing protein [Massilia sp.]|jgi:DUF971 family protein|uniref:DUF971 domain-containing protein n=1 Tax=Massilia sp. TaxID=1882437 RepID=UPI001982F20B|nr:DUF971 domain-containing protein [Oxalobacteraceae sp. CFBP 8761]MBD8633993.1 DUF971 domain-containing protein [Oxalobacteraceae sp. CFBP 8755]MBD8726122.1 DUF971 domain-containing protein [Oxalobacteraceae sp. CFBP 13708]